MSLPEEELGQNVFKYISYIRERGRKVGIVLGPTATLEDTKDYLDQVDLLTFMGVTPGFAKQKLIEPVLEDS